MIASPSLSSPRVPTLRAATPAAAAVRPWWAHLAWVVGARVVGFAVPAIFAGGLHVSRAVFVLPYLLVSIAFLYAYVRWSGVNVYARLREHWIWGIVGAIVAGAFVVNNVLTQPASAAPAGVELVAAILWLGVVYGTLDALLLSILPLFATWQALSTLGWTSHWYGRVVCGALALVASLIVAAAYHFGFPEFRNSSLVAPAHRQRCDEPGFAARDEPDRRHRCAYRNAHCGRAAWRGDDPPTSTALLSRLWCNAIQRVYGDWIEYGCHRSEHRAGSSTPWCATAPVRSVWLRSASPGWRRWWRSSFLAAPLFTEDSYWARIVGWRDAGVDDFATKFAAREIQNAPPVSPLVAASTEPAGRVRIYQLSNPDWHVDSVSGYVPVQYWQPRAARPSRRHATGRALRQRLVTRCHTDLVLDGQVFHLDAHWHRHRRGCHRQC